MTNNGNSGSSSSYMYWDIVLAAFRNVAVLVLGICKPDFWTCIDSYREYFSEGQIKVSHINRLG